MTEYVWINGEVMAVSEARVGVEDRGFQFADGVYEVMRVYEGQPFAMAEHLSRLENSAAGISLELPLSRSRLDGAIRALIIKSGLCDAMVYLQLTRGEARRNHAFPQQGRRPTLLFYVRGLDPMETPGPGVKLATMEDDRWGRCWIKSIALLPNILAKNAALDRGADEALLVLESGGRRVVTECSASTFFAFIDGVLVTHPVGSKVLPGVTRDWVLRIAGELGVRIEERAPGVEEVLASKELFITSTTREISWVSCVDDVTVAEAPSASIVRLQEALRECVEREISEQVSYWRGSRSSQPSSSALSSFSKST